MRLINGFIIAVSLAAFRVDSVLVDAQTPAQPKWTAVEDALGRRGMMQPGNISKFSFPRSDLGVTARGVQLMPTFALGSWLAFKPVTSGGVMVMGDLVWSEDEVSAVIRALRANGIEVAALHCDENLPAYKAFLSRGNRRLVARFHNAITLSQECIPQLDIPREQTRQS